MNQLDGKTPRSIALETAVAPTPTASLMFLRPTAFANDFVSIRVHYPHLVDRRKTTIGGLQDVPHFVNLCPMAQGEQEFSEIGARLASIRQAFSDLSQKAFAEKHNFNQTQYNNWEKGTRRIPVESAERLCTVYGLTLDFIYRGRRDGLSESASKAL
jgi:DNA-binding XRE family transcriptional regulator